MAVGGHCGRWRTRFSGPGTLCTKSSTSTGKCLARNGRPWGSVADGPPRLFQHNHSLIMHADHIVMQAVNQQNSGLTWHITWPECCRFISSLNPAESGDTETCGQKRLHSLKVRQHWTGWDSGKFERHQELDRINCGPQEVKIDGCGGFRRLAAQKSASCAESARKLNGTERRAYRKCWWPDAGTFRRWIYDGPSGE